MKLNLTVKIIAPYTILAILVLILVTVSFVFEHYAQNVEDRNDNLRHIETNMYRLSAYIQAGILVHQESFAIDAARVARETDELLWQLGENNLLRQFENYFAALVAINSVFLENRLQEGQQRFSKLREQEQQIESSIKAQISAAEQERHQLNRINAILKGAMVAVIVVVLVIVSWFASTRIVRPVKLIVQKLNQIIQGTIDLTLRISTTSHDEITDIVTAFNAMMENFQATLRQVSSSAEQISMSTQKSSLAMTRTVQATREQSQATDEARSSVGRMSTGVAQVAVRARTAEAVARSAGLLAHEGRRQAESAAQHIANTASAVRRASELIMSLNSRSEQIRSIVGVIRAIADQTNLLALNAAIEAARAGEQGRGFAVVADEVRKLAERTAKATGEIAAMIDGVGSDIHAAVEVMQEGAHKQDEEVNTAQRLRELLDQISAEVERSLQEAHDIATASNEQTQATDTMSRNVERIAQMAETVSTQSAGTLEAVQELMQLAAEMNEMAGRFKVE